MKKLFLALSLLSVVSLSAYHGGHGGGWGHGGNWGRDVGIGVGVGLGAAALSGYDGYDSGYDNYPIYDSNSDGMSSVYNPYYDNYPVYESDSDDMGSVYNPYTADVDYDRPYIENAYNTSYEDNY